MAIKLTAKNVDEEERKIYESLSDEEKIAFNKLGVSQRAAAQSLEMSYQEYWQWRQECKGKKAPPDYWDTPPGSARLADPETGEILLII